MKLVKQTLVSSLIALWAALPLAPACAGEPDSSTEAGQVISKVNINTADAETIAASLKGIGLKKAQAIVAYREQLGGSYSSLEQLLEVKGIGEKTLAKLKSNLSL